MSDTTTGLDQDAAPEVTAGEEEQEEVIQEGTEDTKAQSKPEGGSETRYEMSDTAYMIMLLHASKYYTSIFGILLGTKTSNNESKSKSNKIEISESIPISHSDTTQYTTPLTEMSLLLLDQYTRTKGKQIVGIYYANGNPLDTEQGVIPYPMVRIADKIHEHFGDGACMLHIDANKLVPEQRLVGACAAVRTKDSRKNKWIKVQGSDGGVLKVSGKGLKLSHLLVMNVNEKERVSSEVKHILPDDVADFEDHCLHAQWDWFNVRLVEQLNHICSSC